jgi:Ca2+-binding RTX toxin-like protein
MFGDDGVDTVSYADRVGGVTVTIGTGFNDGNVFDENIDGSGRDFVGGDVENLIGTDSDDSLSGPSSGVGVNSLRGRGGNDTLSGGTQADTLRGGPGADDLLADPFDTVTYDDHTDAGVSVTADDVANDGNAGDSSGGRRDNLISSPGTLIGTAFPDTLSAGDGDNEVHGRGGTDVINGDGGADEIDGDEGDDVVDGGAGPDDLRTTFGADTVTYASHTTGVFVKSDGQANDGSNEDGPQGARDNVAAGFAVVVGGSGPDQLIGTGAPNDLRGGPGDDTLEGEAGDDRLDGGPGADTLRGGPGADDVATYAGRTTPVAVTLDDDANDGGPEDRQADFVKTEVVEGGSAGDRLTGDGDRNLLRGAAGDDVIRAGGGPDGITGGLGVDQLAGEAGTDTIDSRDGIGDQVSCGTEVDLAVIDLVDKIGDIGKGGVLITDCENVDQAAVDQGPGVRMDTPDLRANADGIVALALRCPPRQRHGCRGRVELRRPSGDALAARAYALRTGESTTVRLRLPARERASLARHRSVVLHAVTTERDPVGRPKTTVKRLAVRPPGG